MRFSFIFYIFRLYFQNQQNILVFQLRLMQDSRNNKQILLDIYQKCKEALPQITVLIERQKIQQWQQPAYKIKQTDCLNPAFLLQLSECGQNIKNILKKALKQQISQRDVLSQYYQQFKKIIKQIKIYHEEAHIKHDVHENSTTMKENLLYQLKEETKRRKALEKVVEDLNERIEDQQNMIRQMQESQFSDDQHIKISEISKISNSVDGHRGKRDKVKKYGLFYGGSESKIGRLYQSQGKNDEFIQDISPKKSKGETETYILQLEAQLQQKNMQCLQYKKDLQEHINLKKEYKQLKKLEKEFSEMYKTYEKPDKGLKTTNFKEENQSSSEIINLEDYYQLLFLQSLTIQDFLKEQEEQNDQ